MIINYLGGSWAPVHRLNEYFLARELPKLAYRSVLSIWQRSHMFTAMSSVGNRLLLQSDLTCYFSSSYSFSACNSIIFLLLSSTLYSLEVFVNRRSVLKRLLGLHCRFFRHTYRKCCPSQNVLPYHVIRSFDLLVDRNSLGKLDEPRR
jgi:hypothetical protein